LFGISRQSVYQAQNRAAGRKAALAAVKPLVLAIRMRMPRLGTRKLYYLLKDELSAAGIKIGRDGLFDYLRAEQLLVRRKKNYTRTTNSKHWLKKHPNLLAKMSPARAEEVFVSDITYVKSGERTHYLSLVTDAYSRRIMGYHLADDLAAESCVQALKMAISERRSQKALIHHSDRGLQYASSVYQQVLRRHRIRASMTDGYDCYQNALAERINGILKQEFLSEICQTGKELEKLIEESVAIYNNERPHLSLQMKTPSFMHEKACESRLTGLDY
jgi:putative transposase